MIHFFGEVDPWAIPQLQLSSTVSPLDLFWRSRFTRHPTHSSRPAWRLFKIRSEMRIFVPAIIVLAVLYFWDVEYNHGTLSDGLISLGRSLIHSFGR
jgi:hypothetical protein